MAQTAGGWGRPGGLCHGVSCMRVRCAGSVPDGLTIFVILQRMSSRNVTSVWTGVQPVRISMEPHQSGDATQWMIPS